MICGNLSSLHSSGLPSVLLNLLSAPELTLAQISAKPDGRYQQEGKTWFYNINYSETSPAASRHTELHTLYADIQIILQGEEIIHYSLNDCSSEEKEEKKPDFFILNNPKLTQSIHLTVGDFAVFFPGEAHQALCMVKQPEKIRKAVFKIPVEMLR
ncbi:YhcH/YjgK/YiaL family protein [Testudinibacter sp. P27/CKL/0425]